MKISTAVIIGHNHAPYPQQLRERWPAVLLPVANKPLGQHMLEWLARHGVTDIIMLVSEHAYEIGQFFGDGRRFGVSLRVVPERTFLGLRESLGKVRGVLPDEFLLVATPLVTALPPGLLELHDGLDVCSAGNGPVLALRAAAADEIPARTADPGPWLEQMERQGRGRRMATAEVLRPVTDFASYFETNMAALRGEAPFPPLASPEPRLGPKAQPDRSATLVPPALIGPAVQIGARAAIGPEAILGQGCVVAEDAQVERSVVFPGTYVGAGCTLSQCVADRDLLARYPDGTVILAPDAFLLGPVPTPHGRRAWASAAAQRFLAALLLLLCLPLLLAGRVMGLRRREILRWGRLRQDGLGGGRSLSPLRLHMLGNGSGIIAWLPSLWDVVRGEAALVGIEPLEEAEAAALLGGWTEGRYAAPVGLIHPWHALARGQAAPVSEEEKRILENEYAMKRSLAVDMDILWRSLLRRVGLIR